MQAATTRPSREAFKERELSAEASPVRNGKAAARARLVGRVMGRYESCQWRSVMAIATTASPELRPTTARTVVRVSTATNMTISIISHPGCRHRSSSHPTSTQLPRLRHACTPCSQSCRHYSSPPPSTQLPRLRQACTPILGATDNSRQLISESQGVRSLSLLRIPSESRAMYPSLRIHAKSASLLVESRRGR
jgi:hypothetical protein